MSFFVSFFFVFLWGNGAGSGGVHVCVTYEERDGESGKKGFGHNDDIVEDKSEDSGEEDGCPHDGDEYAFTESLTFEIHGGRRRETRFGFCFVFCFAPGGAVMRCDTMRCECCRCR